LGFIRTDNSSKRETDSIRKIPTSENVAIWWS
jgi:hypothetical protein